MPSWLLLALVVAGVTGAAIPRARAQTGDQATARALFAEGRRMMKAGKYAEACPKLEAAQKLYPSAGILLNLGDCYEKIGKTASAWNEFGEAASLAARSNRADDADEARRRQEAIEPALVRMVIRVPSPVSGLVVTRDGVKLAEATWGSTLPVDPGEHALHAEADGYEPWSSSVTITRRGDTATVTVPKLKASPTAERASGAERIPESKPAATARSGGHGLAWALLISGAAVGAGGGALMFVESQRAQDARTRMDPPGYEATRTPWTIGLVGAIAGGLTAIGGVVLFAVGPGDSESTATSASAWVAPDGGGGIRVSGFW